MAELHANIHPGAKIAPNVTIEPFATIQNDVVIGEGTWVGPGAVIMSGSRIGSHCEIFPGAVIGAKSQDLKYAGEYTTVEIGDYTSIRECVTVHRGTSDRMKTVVGNNCLLMAYVHVAHDCIIGNHVVIANGTQVAGHVIMEDWVVVEGMVGIQQFVTLGTHAFVAASSMVRKNVPPYVKDAREPLSFVGVNTIGLRRRGFSDEQIIMIEDIYRIIYVQNGNITTALKIVDMELPASNEKDSIIQFIRSSTKGIIRGLNTLP
jgi:UDP-N-acetylglucosamine acyltransferase